MNDLTAGEIARAEAWALKSGCPPCCADRYAPVLATYARHVGRDALAWALEAARMKAALERIDTAEAGAGLAWKEATDAE